MDLVFAPSQIETWPLDRLQPYARNAKIHGTDQVAKIAASMAKFGWTVPCMVADEGELIAHCRDHLSPIKCPRSVDFDPALPRLDNGKLYKRLLKDRYWAGHETRV